MSINERIQTIKSIGVFVKDFFWNCDNIGEETLLEGDTPEITAELLKTQNNADKKYASLSSSNSNSTKGGKGGRGNSTRKQELVDKVELKPLKNVNEKATKKSSRNTISEEIGER